MKPKSMDLVWISVNDVKKAVKFYTETVGLKLKEFDENYGWAELEGQHGGATIGLAQCQPNSEDNIRPGQNGVMTLTVDNLENTIAHLTKQGAKLVGKVQEVPGHVKLQMVADSDGNHFQLVQELSRKSCCSCH